MKFLFLIHPVRTYICSNLRTLGVDIINDLINIVGVSYLAELSNNISISVFCGIIKVTFINLSYHVEHKESIIQK